MASAFDGIENLPIWQRLIVWVLGAAMLAAVWWFLFYVDAVEAREAAEGGLAKANTELERLQKKKENFLEEQRQHEERKAKSRENLEIVPVSSSAVDNLMETFQQKARQVGVSFDFWTNEPEQRQDVYARMPVKVKARGSWAQIGEFFRQLGELRRPLSIENVRLELQTAKREEDSDVPMLALEFEAATYRALSAEELSAPQSARQPSRRSRSESGGGSK
ncbi:type IV pilus inner membrane component PilO [Paraliomyxa miuraensis]|uniref:type 4a pilus biogenesis protein PilO n=1 Tax=Paraliomyxa miuraensis TaxID=376150 RepID=UPI002259EF31|nr:type 4a pilus biogenesis protein PilO [Paraliomyxa miuraensis]MCX4240279.1 type 4a pilus biogenesis protein PilO [Paraliomyxa miuraensis]